ncbi:hypothetical protein DH2020_006998 [Rehmannia glutinosa]|uniref:ENTH domain-containing protein n=1 Tax=Rehmannia glutinosa TaxID=99300 RepID=A0ABR0W450_REHGL
MNGPIFHEFKKQASFFLKEKIKTARLALTDVTPAQLLAEEATNESPGGPDARTLKMISKAAFEVDDYWRIVEILHKRLVRFDRRNWRGSYKAVIVVEHLLTHGPERVAEEFQTDRDVIRQMGNFQHIDEKGFNWGLNVRQKCERILKLLEKGPLLKQEREKARKISREIKGFGSFCLRSSGLDQENVIKPFGRCNSEFNNQEDFFSDPNENFTIKTETEKPELETLRRESYDTRVDSKENVAPDEGVLVESKPLLGEQNDESGNYVPMKDDHPFDETEHLTGMSLLSTAC